jgi:hypothetical protein
MSFKSGDYIFCSIKGVRILDARIHIRDGREVENGFRAYICHNNPDFEGDSSPEKYGYMYSWTFTCVGGMTSDNVSDLVPAFKNGTPKEKIQLDDDISTFLRLNAKERLMVLFTYKLGIFDEFDIYEMSKNSGFLVLKSRKSKKSLEIKIGRFIKQMLIKYKQTIGITSTGESFLELTDKDIEDLHNKYVSYQRNDELIQFLSGKPILEAYTKANYPPDNGSVLHKSCMVDRLPYLGIYTDNPNQVELAVVTIDGKIVARSFIWTATDGNKYYDRIYFAYDWLNNLMCSKLEARGIKPIQKENFKEIQLENWKFPQYPYLDSFYYFNVEKGKLFFINVSDVRQLRNTDGRL